MNISILINDFLKQNIQSEAEVRSKLIVPLLELLEYPKDLRAEEFPVHGYEGSVALRSKAADFLQFTSNEFDINRGKSDKELEWVYNHSLLVFEAKKPTEQILVKGQPVFYSAWTKAVAYIISNGVNIEGYIVNANYSDTRVFSCSIKEIPEKWEEINVLNYYHVLDLKNKAKDSKKWTKNDSYEVYKNVMRVRCTEELYASIDRNLEEITYDLNIIKSGKCAAFNDILDNTSKIITSEPGGGKSYLMWMLLREYLMQYDEDCRKIPVLIEGRYFGKVYNSIIEAIYNELKVMLPFITKELIEKRLYDGNFVILFDALDEVELEYDTLVFELHHLSRDTDNTIIITSRIQNYRGDFSADFVHYSLEPLSDDRVIELLEKYSNGKMQIQIHQIPKSLLELIRTPLFLKMFVTISKNENTYKIPANRAVLFEMYLTEKLKCSFYEETITRRILCEYAIYSYENDDCTEKFFEILNINCESHKREKVFELIWKTGIIFNGLQGIKYFHKAVQEFFVALYLSSFDRDKLCEWLEQSVHQDKYNEIICYLTGIIANQQKQNYVLDFLEVHNLKLYMKALKSRRNFGNNEQVLNKEYAQKYYAQILKSYDNIIKTHFYNICNAFDGYKINRSENHKVCIKGVISFLDESISMVIFSGTSEIEQINVMVSTNNKTHLFLVDGKEVPMYSSVFTRGKTHERYYNLGLLSYGFDSSREIAIDIIKKQIKSVIENKTQFDMDLEVLLAEQIESRLEKNRIKNKETGSSEQLSLYTNSILEIINKIELADNYNQELDLILLFCKLLELKTNNVEMFLDVKPDIKIKNGMHIQWKHELYSNDHLVKKIKKVLALSQNATKKIVEDIIPVLSDVRSETRIIGIVHRNDKHAGVEYIEVNIEPEEDNEPIIEFREEAIKEYPELDIYYIEKLKLIGKSEQDVIGSMSSTLRGYFEDNLFHKIIYERIEKLFEKLFDGLLY